MIIVISTPKDFDKSVEGVLTSKGHLDLPVQKLLKRALGDFFTRDGGVGIYVEDEEHNLAISVMEDCDPDTDPSVLHRQQTFKSEV